jgi:hypothetical protein
MAYMGRDYIAKVIALIVNEELLERKVVAPV